MRDALQEQLLSIMDRKDHWAWPRFTQPGLSRAQLLVHFRHEYQTYVRDFPVLLARVYGLGPPSEVRAALAENIYEEETGRLSLGVSHPTLFLEMMSGLGFSASDLEGPGLEPESLAYRLLLDAVSGARPWQVGAAVLTIFVEGSRNERAALAGTRLERPVEEAIAQHPLVVHYGCPPAKMRLVRAHRLVEGGHRDDAWKMILEHAAGHEGEIVAAASGARVAWTAYRDGVAPSDGSHLTPPRHGASSLAVRASRPFAFD